MNAESTNDMNKKYVATRTFIGNLLKRNNCVSKNYILGDIQLANKKEANYQKLNNNQRTKNIKTLQELQNCIHLNMRYTQV